jgi:hypothetical protein
VLAHVTGRTLRCVRSHACLGPAALSQVQS